VNVRNAICTRCNRLRPELHKGVCGQCWADLDREASARAEWIATCPRCEEPPEGCRCAEVCSAMKRLALVAFGPRWEIQDPATGRALVRGGRRWDGDNEPRDYDWLAAADGRVLCDGCGMPNGVHVRCAMGAAR
jgi:hypothetical protein